MFETDCFLGYSSRELKYWSNPENSIHPEKVDYYAPDGPFPLLAIIFCSFFSLKSWDSNLCVDFDGSQFRSDEEEALGLVKEVFVLF